MGKRCKVSEFQSSLNSNPDFGNAPPFALQRCSALKKISASPNFEGVTG